MNTEYPGMSDPTQFVVTETGYHTDSISGYSQGVSELAHVLFLFVVIIFILCLLAFLANTICYSRR